MAKMLANEDRISLDGEIIPNQVAHLQTDDEFEVICYYDYDNELPYHKGESYAVSSMSFGGYCYLIHKETISIQNQAICIRMAFSMNKNATIKPSTLSYYLLEQKLRWITRSEMREQFADLIEQIKDGSITNKDLFE